MIQILSKTSALRICIILCTTILTFQVAAQNGIRLNTPDAFDGYKLCNTDEKEVFLLNNCGEIINRWTNIQPSFHCKLTEEGNLYYIQNGIIEKDWNGNTISTIKVNSANIYLEYEAIKLKNGNYLAVCRRIRNEQYFIDRGWPPNYFTPNTTDGVVEVDPSGNIVWEWNIGDHTIQDVYSDKMNYGVIKDHPELVNVKAISNYDWQFPESFMINGMDYNEELDQIVVSVRKLGEFMVIDHSTTTEEAAGSTGGNSSKGGNILYRWGNPKNYGQGSTSDQTLFFQHNPNWIKYGEHKGKFIVYNNGLSQTYPNVGSMSSVHIIDPPIDSNGQYILDEDYAYEPEYPDLTINKLTTDTYFYSGYTSGAQVLPNGNIYITVGYPSEFMEVKPDGEKVWEYKLVDITYIFRSEQYPRDFPGFEGKDMTANGTVEFPSSTYECEEYTSTHTSSIDPSIQIRFDQFSNSLHFKGIDSKNNVLQIFNSQGLLIRSYSNISDLNQISIEAFTPGMYVVSYLEKNKSIFFSEKIIKL